MLNSNTGSIETHQCEAWDFDNSTWTSTLNSEFNLACGSAYLASSFTSLYFMGWGFGAAFNSLLCDMYGRKTMFCLGVCLVLLCVLVPWLPSIGMILVFRFIIGFGGAFMMDSSRILSMEIVEPRLRPALMSIGMPWVLGTMAVAGLGWYFRDWRTLQMAVSLPYLLMIPIFWSPNELNLWLFIASSHIKKLVLLRKAAKWQNVTLPSDAELEVIMDECSSQSKIRDDYLPRSRLGQMKMFFQRFSLLFRTPRLRTLTLVAYLGFTADSLVYVAMAIDGVKYSDDPFVYMVLSGLMELPSSTINVPILFKFGRKIPGMFFFFSTGVCCLVLPFIPSDIQWLTMTLALLAKGLIGMAWAALYLQCTELFPTEVRILGLGSCGIMTSIGSSLSEYISDLLTPVVPWAPSVIFGTTSILGSLALTLLPESKGVPMPETIHELENRDYSKILREEKPQITATEMKQSNTSLPSLNHA
ncbi:unnamed protein product, partial [Meganyctiphanes norvegica]